MGEMLEAAAKAVIELETRAAEVDLAGRFPTENYELLRTLGYLRGPVPAELGGLDATLEETVAAQRIIAAACASTALAVNMHLFQVGAAAEGWRGSGANEPALRRVAEDGIVLGSTGAEAIVAGAWDTGTVATPDGEGYRITGRKFFCSQADVMDVVRVNAKDAATGEILVVAISASAEGVSVDPTWDTMGMRATASHDLVLDDVFVPATAVGARLPAEGPAWDPAFARAIRWFLSGVSGVYVGIADRAREVALASLGTGNNTTYRAEALTEEVVGRMETAHFRASSLLETGVRRVAAEPDVVEAMVVAMTTKQEATAAAAEVVDHAVTLVGGRSYFRKSVLERLVRDMHAARFHPPSAPVSHQMIGIHRLRASA
ncbi:MAG TPA: acyl-CoA dehydrogenase family protein [Acidimicrobiia bacterium]|nr:acyl-CoA dehydrogenase family protein [Acidimicrobiia bacterium]